MGSNQHALRSTRTCLRVLSRALPWYHLHLRVAKTSYVLLCQYDCTLFLNIRFVRFFFLFFFVINSDSLRLHGHQGKSFHIRHGTFKYRISVSGLHTKHESSLKCSHIRHKSGLWIRNPKWKLRIRTLWLRNFRSCSWVIPVNPYSLLSFWFAFDLAFQVGSSSTYTELTDLSPRMVFMQDPVLLFGYVWSYKWYQFLFQQLWLCCHFICRLNPVSAWHSWSQIF